MAASMATKPIHFCKVQGGVVHRSNGHDVIYSSTETNEPQGKSEEEETLVCLTLIKEEQSAFF